MAESIKISAVLPASPERLYEAWLDSGEHGKFTGSKAVIDPRKGGSFTAWDGCIQGRNLELEPGKRIVQSWRTTEFPSRSPDSRIEVLFEKSGKGRKSRLCIPAYLTARERNTGRDGWTITSSP